MFLVIAPDGTYSECITAVEAVTEWAQETDQYPTQEQILDLAHDLCQGFRIESYNGWTLQDGGK